MSLVQTIETSHWTTFFLLFGSFAILYIGRQAFRSRSRYPLPPGPPGFPWVGTVIGVDTGAPWITYAEWARKYGDIIYSKLMGKDVVILNSEKIAMDLFEKRSRNYSSRPYFLTNEMCGLSFNSGLLPYGDRWRLHRRFFHQTFRLDAMHRFLPLQHRKSCRLLQQLLDTPDELDDHVFEYTASILLNSTYDYDPSSRKDEFVDSLENLQTILIPVLRADVAIITGAFPFLRHLPSWFPGMSFKRQLGLAREISGQYLERPFRYSIQKESSRGVASSVVHDALRGMDERGNVPEEAWMQALKEASMSVILAATESSHAFVMMFFLMMVLNPEAQEKAQAQIDTVVGTARLPTIDDRPLLPFVDAILWETFRCKPVVPLLVPHVSMEDDVYEGFFIPKDTMLIANLWSMGHDESRFPDPHRFIPERFLEEDGSLKPKDIEHIVFGFGRRICVGRYFADASLWTVIAKVLAVFKILNPLNENGAEVPVEPKYSSGLVIHPLPFKCRIVPRFPRMDPEKLEELIAASDA